MWERVKLTLIYFILLCFAKLVVAESNKRSIERPRFKPITNIYDFYFLLFIFISSSRHVEGKYSEEMYVGRDYMPFSLSLPEFSLLWSQIVI